MVRAIASSPFKGDPVAQALPCPPVRYGIRPCQCPSLAGAGQCTARERSLLNRGLCCENGISSAAPDPGGKELLAWGVNELRRPRGCRGAAHGDGADPA